MGHMTQIANKLHIAVETRQEVAEHVQNSSQWQDYFTTHLAPRNEVSFLNMQRNVPYLCSAAQVGAWPCCLMKFLACDTKPHYQAMP